MLLLQSCPTLGDPMDCSPPGSSVYGILQARLLEWVAMPSFRGPSRPRDRTCILCVSCIAGRFFTLEPQWKPFQWLFTGFIFSNVSILTFQCLYIVDISPVNSIVLMVIFFISNYDFFFLLTDKLLLTILDVFIPPKFIFWISNAKCDGTGW